MKFLAILIVLAASACTGQGLMPREASGATAFTAPVAPAPIAPPTASVTPGPVDDAMIEQYLDAEVAPSPTPSTTPDDSY